MPNKLSRIVYMHNIFHSTYFKECAFKWKTACGCCDYTTRFISVVAVKGKKSVMNVYIFLFSQELPHELRQHFFLFTEIKRLSLLSWQRQHVQFLFGKYFTLCY